MSNFESKLVDCASCECCDMLHVCEVEDSKVQLDLGIWDATMQKRSFGSKIVRWLARVFCGQAVLLLAIAVSGCFDFPLLPDEVAASKVHITVVSTGLGAAYPLADKWMARDIEFGAVTVTGGGSDDCIWTEKAVPPNVVDEYVAWVITCAKQVDGIYSVVIEVDGEEVAIWRTSVNHDLGELVEILVIVIGDEPEGFAAHWSPKYYRANQIQHEGNSWTFELHEFYVKEFARHVSFVGQREHLAIQYGISKISVFQSLADGKQKHIEGWAEE